MGDFFYVEKYRPFGFSIFFYSSFLIFAHFSRPCQTEKNITQTEVYFRHVFITWGKK